MELCPKCGKKGLHAPSVVEMLQIAAMHSRKSAEKVCRYCDYIEFMKVKKVN